MTDDAQLKEIDALYEQAKDAVDTARDRITEINLQIKAPIGPQRRRELYEERKKLKNKVADAQATCAKYRKKRTVAFRGVTHFFIDLMRDEILGADLFDRYWKEAHALRNKAMLDAGEREERLDHQEYGDRRNVKERTRGKK